MTIRMFQKKSAVIDVTVKTADVAKDISSGTPRAVLIAPNGGEKTLTTVLTGATGVIQITIPNNTADPHGRWIAECALVIGEDDRTVWQEDVLAAQSHT